MSHFDHVAVLLGAGASVDARLPTSVEMTDKIIANFDYGGRHVQLLNYIRHTLEADAATRDTSSPVDVERLFAAIELLIDRYAQPWSPFVSTWSPGLESFSVPGHRAPLNLAFELQAVDRAIAAASGARSATFSRNPFGSERASKVIADAIEKGVRSVRPQHVELLLKQLRAEMLGALFRVLHVSSESPVEYLAPLLDLAEQQGSLTIATLNYDRTIEEAAARTRVRCDTGIETWLAQGQFAWKAAGGLRLLKLHGSIDWEAQEVVEDGKLPFLRITKRPNRGDSPLGASPAIVFGEGGKLRAEGPFLELLLAWSNQLKSADSLLVVGYSFRDSHVNEIVVRWFNDAPNRRIILLDPAPSQGLRGPQFHLRLGQLGVSQGPKQPAPFTRVHGTAAHGLVEAIGYARDRRRRMDRSE